MASSCFFELASQGYGLPGPLWPGLGQEASFAFIASVRRVSEHDCKKLGSVFTGYRDTSRACAHRRRNKMEASLSVDSGGRGAPSAPCATRCAEQTTRAGAAARLGSGHLRGASVDRPVCLHSDRQLWLPTSGRFQR